MCGLSPRTTATVSLLGYYMYVDQYIQFPVYVTVVVMNNMFVFILADKAIRPVERRPPMYTQLTQVTKDNGEQILHKVVLQTCSFLFMCFFFFVVTSWVHTARPAGAIVTLQLSCLFVCASVTAYCTCAINYIITMVAIM